MATGLLGTWVEQDECRCVCMWVCVCMIIVQSRSICLPVYASLKRKRESVNWIINHNHASYQEPACTSSHAYKILCYLWYQENVCVMLLRLDKLLVLECMLCLTSYLMVGHMSMHLCGTLQQICSPARGQTDEELLNLAECVRSHSSLVSWHNAALSLHEQPLLS